MSKSQSHLELIEDWIAWRDAGIGVVRWSASYRLIQVPYLSKFLDEFRTVSAHNLETCLRTIPVHSHSKRKHIHSAVSSFAQYLTQKGLLSSEERERIRRLYPKRDRYSPPKQHIINAEQLAQLIKTAKGNLHRYQAKLNTALIRTMALTGLRVSELCNLKLSDVIFDPLQRAHIRVVLGKGGKSRVVPLTNEARTVITNYLKARPNKSFKELFLGFNPKHGYRPLDRHAVAQRFRRISAQTGINFTSHSLRHFAITAWSKQLTLPLIQKLAGHSSLSVTQGYLHLQDSDLFEAFERLA